MDLVVQVKEVLMKFLKTLTSKLKHSREKKFPVYHSFDKDFVSLINKAGKELGDAVFDIQGIANKHMDIVSYTKNFLDKSSKPIDRTVDPNANNSDKSILQYNQSNNKALMRLNSLYILWLKIKQHRGLCLANKCIYSIIDGSLFVNDLHNILTSYCYAFDLSTLVNEGMSFFKGNMTISKPKRSSSFIDLIIQSTSYISNQITGAIAYPNFFVYLNYFYEKEFGSDYIKELGNKRSKTHLVIREQFQNLIYSLNFTFRGTESSFTNLSVLDKGFIDHLFEGLVFPDGTSYDDTSKNNTVELSKRFFEYYTYINMREGVFTFPVMTLAISIDERNQFVDKTFVNWVAKENSEKSLGNVFMSLPNSFSSCCRLINNIQDMYQNSFGVSGVSIGSHRVAGINFFRCTSEADINEKLDLLHYILFAQRHIVNEQIENGVHPLYTNNWIFLQKQYSTIGFIGLYELLEKNIIDLTAVDILNRINGLIKSWPEHDKNFQQANHLPVLKTLYNIEQIPAESIAVRLAKVDRILGYNKEYELYANQYLPLEKKASMIERIRVQGKMDRYTSGGAILHLNYNGVKPIPKNDYKSLMNMCNNYGVKYFSINYVFDKCINGHYSRSTSSVCPLCGDEIKERYTRVVGFMTSVNNWNKTRREHDFPNRHFYSEITQ